MSNLNELKAELNRANQKIESLTKGRDAAARAAQSNVLEDVVALADMAYRSFNSKALMEASSLDAPAGDAPAIRPHRQFLPAFESILDGIDEALKGFKRGNFTRYGLYSNEEFYKKKLAELAADNDNMLFTDAGKPVSEDVDYCYHRYVEITTLIDRLEKMQEMLLRAYDNADTGEGEGYVPKDERIANSRKKKEETAEKVEAVSRQLDDILKNAPKLEIKRSA